jgi:lysophospholipase L1-like esterase
LLIFAKLIAAMENCLVMRGLKNCGLVCLLLLLTGWADAQQNTWIATWAASPQAADQSPDDPLIKIANQTVRQRVRVSIGGTQIRIRLSNEYGSAPLLVGALTVAAPVHPESIQPKSLQTVTFDGQKSILIPAGAPILSDPVPYPVTPGSEISISIYFPKPVSTPTIHALGLKRAVLSRPGDHSLAEKIDAATTFESSILVSAVLVPVQPSQHLVVAFGDSLTDGDMSTVDADHNWPSDLIRRLQGTPNGSKTAIVNEGIAGNRLLGEGFGVNGLARFDRDALALQGVSHIVLLEGINDISFPGAKLGGSYLADPHDARTPEDLILAYRQLISRAHAHGVKLIGATMTPCEGVEIPGYYSESKDAVRQAVNKWIRTSGSFDGVIDFDAVLRDPDHPSRISPRFASEDHLHPNDAGYQAMADAIDLALLR